MPDLSAYIGWHDDGAVEDWTAQFARDPGFMIGHRGVSVVLYRAGVAQTAQDFLIAPLGQTAQTRDANTPVGQGSRDELLVLGMADADIQKGDEFHYQAVGTRRNYRVVWVEKAAFNSTQARAEQIQ